MNRKLKNILKELLPPYLVRKLRGKDNIVWSGDYNSWSDALRNSTGYDNNVILEKVKQAILAVKNNENLYERDSVLFDSPQYSWPLLAGLLSKALDNNESLRILDFGGSLGSSYFQHRNFLSNINSLKWNVVEQPHFVSCGKEYFQSNELKFYNDFDVCVENESPNVLIASSVLQYLEQPYNMIKKFIDSSIPMIIIDRTQFLLEGDRDRLTIQMVPPSIYDAVYPAWFFNKNKFIDSFTSKYSLIAEFDSIGKTNLQSESKGFIFKQNQLQED